MKVIILKDVPKLGKKNEIKNVSDGFARNYLFPKKIAKPATETDVEEVEKKKAKDIEKEKKELVDNQKLASEIDGLEVEVSAKVSEKGELYSSFSSDKISQKLKEMGYEISKDKIEPEESIKHIGEHKVKVSFGHGLEAELNVIVSNEEESLDKEN